MVAGPGHAVNQPQLQGSPCVVVSGEISMDTRDEGKSINTAASPAPLYTDSVEQVQWKQCICTNLSHTHMCHNLSTHIRVCV